MKAETYLHPLREGLLVYLTVGRQPRVATHFTKDVVLALPVARHVQGARHGVKVHEEMGNTTREETFDAVELHVHPPVGDLDPRKIVLVDRLVHRAVVLDCQKKKEEGR